MKAFEAIQDIVSTRAVRGYFWPVRELFKDNAEPHAEVISNFLEPIVQRALERKQKMREAGVASSTEHDTFLDYLTDNTEGEYDVISKWRADAEPLPIADTKVIRDQLLNILLAGRDTTSCLLTYVTYAMAMYPDVARKMRAEVLEHCGTTEAPTFEKIKSLRYGMPLTPRLPQPFRIANPPPSARRDQ